MPANMDWRHPGIKDTSGTGQEILKECQRLCDERTAMLCEAMGIVEDSYRHLKMGVPPSIMSPELYKWWRQHQKWDAERREQGR